MSTPAAAFASVGSRVRYRVEALCLLAAFLLGACGSLLCAAEVRAPRAGLLDIRDFGAVGDGATLNTNAIQAAIDACSEQRAGGVLVAGGRFVTGTLYLKSYVTLRIAGGAELLGSTEIRDYATDTHANQYRGEPHMDRCLIFARGAALDGIRSSGADRPAVRRSEFAPANAAAPR